jgi:hypothetical protein
VHAQPLGHLVLKEIELLPRDQQLFSKTQFGHFFLPLRMNYVLSGRAELGELAVLAGLEKPLHLLLLTPRTRAKRG